jgi:sterol desaturase/sphingolipid hydroxylase (fatty acid hydroxylase superfamily)
MAVPALLLGFSPLALLIYSVVYQWHSILLHSNVRVSFGPLEAVISTPRFHHWHHADEPEAYDRNFGGQLVIWDRLFGTAFDPALNIPGRYPERFGVDQPPREDFFAHILAPFARRRSEWPT